MLKWHRQIAMGSAFDVAIEWGAKDAAGGASSPLREDGAAKHAEVATPRGRVRA